MEGQYNFIGQSINNLAMQPLFSTPLVDINNQIIATVREKNNLLQADPNTPAEEIDALDQKIKDLKDERDRASQFRALLIQNSSMINGFSSNNGNSNGM